MRIGNGYLGSSGIETSTSNQEVIPAKPVGQTVDYVFRKFAFYNIEATQVIINNGDPIYLDERQGFSIDVLDAPIKSFKIVSSGVKYNWIGMY